MVREMARLGAMAADERFTVVCVPAMCSLVKPHSVLVFAFDERYDSASVITTNSGDGLSAIIKHFAFVSSPAIMHSKRVFSLKNNHNYKWMGLFSRGSTTIQNGFCIGTLFLTTFENDSEWFFKICTVLKNNRFTKSWFSIIRCNFLAYFS